MRIAVEGHGRKHGPVARHGVYTFVDWRPVHDDAYRIVYQPPTKACLWRLRWTVLAVIAMLAVYAIRSRIADQAIRWGWMPAMADLAVWGAMGLVALLGLSAPIIPWWHRLTIELDGRGNLTVRVRKLVSSSRSWPINAFTRIAVLAQEVVGGSPWDHGRAGYRWRIQLIGPGGPNNILQPLVEFWPYHQHTRPPQEPLPERVASLVNVLQRMTGLVAPKPLIIHSPVDSPLASRGRRHMTISAPVIESHTYGSLDEMPQELRADVEQIMDEAQQAGDAAGEHRVISRQAFAYRDSDGNEYTVDSLEKMPPEMRALYERIRQQMKETE